MYYDIPKIKREIKKLNIPGKFFRINIDQFFSHDYYMMISIRENAGKTTQNLIFGAVLYKLYGTTTEYIRCDTAQIRQKGIENLYNTMRSLGYIERIFDGKWNDVLYKVRSRKFYLCHKDSDGMMDAVDENPICCVHSNEESEDLKSAYNNPNGNFILFDEFMDSKRATMNQWIEFMTNISTIGRPETRLDEKTKKPLAHVMMCGNNKNMYSHWFDDFCISEEIQNIRFGHYFEMKTKMGTSMVVYMLDQSEDLKEKVEKGLIHFFGFDTKKSAQFNGITEWSGRTYNHLNFSIRDLRPVYNRLFIRHRNRLIQLELYKDKNYFVFAHFASAPLYDDNIILCLDPVEKTEVYGYGTYERNQRVYELIRTFIRLKYENRWYYASNFVGEICDDFEKNIEK